MNAGKAFGALAFLTLISRVSGFLRVAIFASFYGGGTESDIFLSVMILPELMYKFMTEGLVASASIPLFVRMQKEPEALKKAFWTLFWCLFLFSGALVVMMIYFGNQICAAMVPGFLAQTHSRMAILWYIIVPYALFAFQSGLMTAFLNAQGIFAKPAWGPILVNAAIIAGIFMGKGGPVEYVAISVLVGGIIQFLWLFWLVNGNGASWIPPWDKNSYLPQVLREFTTNSAPIACWILLTPIVPFFERNLLSSQSEGAVSILNYTDKLFYLPMGIVSISLASAVFPLLSEKTPKERPQLLLKTLWGLTIFLFPLLVILQSGGHTFVSLIYQRGKFDLSAVDLTVGLLKTFSWSLLPASASMLLNRFFFAEGNFRIPFIFGILSIVLQVSLDWKLVGDWGYTGVAWGAVIAASIQILLLLGAVANYQGRALLAEAAVPLLGSAILTLLLVKPTILFLEILGNNLMFLGKFNPICSLALLWIALQCGTLLTAKALGKLKGII